MNEAKQATPHSELIKQLMDSRVPKTEREHAARREIEMLREALRLPAALDAPEREWVGLTEEDWRQIWGEFYSSDVESDFQEHMVAKYGAGHYTDNDLYWNFQKGVIEQIVNRKLKEKNT